MISEGAMKIVLPFSVGPAKRRAQDSHPSLQPSMSLPTPAQRATSYGSQTLPSDLYKNWYSFVHTFAVESILKEKRVEYSEIKHRQSCGLQLWHLICAPTGVPFIILPPSPKHLFM